MLCITVAKNPTPERFGDGRMVVVFGAEFPPFVHEAALTFSSSALTSHPETRKRFVHEHIAEDRGDHGFSHYTVCVPSHRVSLAGHSLLQR
jgi:hypothetical protein